MNHRRAGIALVELMVGIAIAAALVTTASVLINRLFTANRVAHEHAQTITNLGRLGEDFRRDAHAAFKAGIESVNDQPSRMTFVIPADGEPKTEKQIVYSIAPHSVERIVRSGDKALHRDTYLLPGMRPLEWTLSNDHREAALAIGRLAQASPGDTALRGKFSIVAVLPQAQDTSAP